MEGTGQEISAIRRREVQRTVACLTNTCFDRSFVPSDGKLRGHVRKTWIQLNNFEGSQSRPIFWNFVNSNGKGFSLSSIITICLGLVKWSGTSACSSANDLAWNFGFFFQICKLNGLHAFWQIHMGILCCISWCQSFTSVVLPDCFLEKNHASAINTCNGKIMKHSCAHLHLLP